MAFNFINGLKIDESVKNSIIFKNGFVAQRFEMQSAPN